MPNQESEFLAAYLQQRDVACPACTYNLRGLATDRCPECHQQLVMSVSLAEPPIVQFVLATIGLAACGVGFGMLFLVVVAVCIKENDTPGGEIGAMLIWAPLAILGADSVAVILFLSASGRRWFRSSPRRQRLTFVACCWGFSLFVLCVWLTLLFAKVM